MTRADSLGPEDAECVMQVLRACVDPQVLVVEWADASTEDAEQAVYEALTSFLVCLARKYEKPNGLRIRQKAIELAEEAAGSAIAALR